MTRTSKESTVEVRRLVAAPPARVYGLISDVTRMGEWSPETAGVPIADWAYDLSADGTGCLVVESWAAETI